MPGQCQFNSKQKFDSRCFVKDSAFQAGRPSWNGERKVENPGLLEKYGSSAGCVWNFERLMPFLDERLIVWEHFFSEAGESSSFYNNRCV
jgi:hypothetical protein